MSEETGSGVKRALGVLLSLGLLVSGAACREHVTPPAEVPAAAPAEEPTRTEPPPPTAPVAEPAPPEAGEVRVTLDAAGVHLFASEALLSHMLAELASQGGFELLVEEGAYEDRRLTARIDAPLSDVLAVVLRGVEYRVAFRSDGDATGHRVARVRVGTPPEPRVNPIDLLLDHREATVVIAAIDAVAEAGDPAAVAVLEPLLADDDVEVREAALAAIEELEEWAAEE